jgi:ABC-type transporter Mla subunit MlaD
MVKIIGLILLIYGIAGIIATFLVYGALRGPLQKLRELLELLSRLVAESGVPISRVSDWVDKSSALVQIIADQLAKVVAAIRETAKRFGDAAGFLESVEATLDAVAIPFITPEIKNVEVSFSTEIVSGVQLEDYVVAGVTVYGPPLKIDKTPLEIDLGELPILSGFTNSNLYPLKPAGDVFRAAGEKVDGARQHLDNAGDLVEQVRDRALEVKQNVQNTAQGMKDFAGKLRETSQNILEISENKLLALIPALALGYFGLIHLMFALTGLALFML